ncbi:MAG: GGDEF domain-containing protein [Chitinispirillaceae bacterium]|nr:GGDEF domain-containing protein [Chitinispirillaceae bacterium]
MRRRPNFTLLLVGMLLIATIAIHFIGGKASAVGVPVLLFGGSVICFAAGSALRHKRGKKPAPATTEVSLPRIFQKQAAAEVEPVDPVAALGRAYRKEQWTITEATVDNMLDAGIELLWAHIKPHTAAIFFPTLDGGYRLRRFKSQSDCINRDAVLYPGVGVIGGFLKEGLRQLNLKEIISDSMTLYYYTKDAGIRSLMASPIVAGGIERGTIIVDSTVPKKFTDEDHAFLRAAAALLGNAVYGSYLYTEHKLQHGRLAAMSSIEKEFFRNLSRSSIVEKISAIVPLALPFDRLTISMKNEDAATSTLLAAVGADADAFINKRFSLKEKSLASVLYANNLVLSRNYSNERPEVRYFNSEPRNDELRSFAAVPLGVDECRGMLLVESSREDVYDESYREFLGRLSTSAGLAIEKMLIFEKANALATHDGLTGLYNHRTFQQLLADEITRTIRYDEPVSLVICDIDFFKKINDSYGHPFGDVVLKGVSSLLENSVRQDIDTVARYGGEEFALILVKTTDEGAAETADRIRNAVADLPFKSPAGDDVRLTMSFGIAEYRKHARQMGELIAKADKALYRAKKNGRNRVEVF